MSGLLLLVEDNEQILYGNERMLKRRGYDVMTALTLGEARERMRSRKPDAIVLDIVLPDGSGLEFMRDLRKQSNIPILLLTGLKTSDDIVRGLTEGGDYYLTKPYDFNVLLAHIEALLRRTAQMPDGLQKGFLKLDIAAGLAFLRGKNLLLTKTEFALLMMFIQHEGITLGMEQIYEKIWKAPIGKDLRSLRRQISNLRTKLEEGQYDFMISTVYGEGYRFEKNLSFEL